MSSEPGSIPRWMRFSSYRDFEEKAQSTRHTIRIALLCLFGTFVAVSIVTYQVYPLAFHLPVLAACGVAFTAMVLGIRECTIRVTWAYIAVGTALNCMMTFIAVNEETLSVKIALAGVILFTGLTGILIISRTKEKLSILRKGAIMGTAAAILIASMNSNRVPTDGILEYAKLWLLAAIAPMTFLIVMTFVILIAYHRTEQTLPSDKWV